MQLRRYAAVGIGDTGFGDFGWIVPIPGTTKLHRLRENAEAASIQLSEGDLREIENATSGITVQGARYSEGAQRMINR